MGGKVDRIPGERRRRRPTASGTVLTEDLIVDCALRLIGEHGAEGLSVRRLGAALGCDPTAVYRYFAGTDDLLLAVNDRIIGETMRGFRPGPDWVESLRDLARRVCAAYRAHPRTAAVAATRVTRRKNEFHAVETGIGILRRAGFSNTDAVRYYQAFIDTVLGHAVLEATFLSLSAEQREADETAWGKAYRELPAATHPNIAAVRDDLRAMAGSPFETAVDLFLSGLAARL
jgi:AcrR family transcriptional regulator